MTTLYNKFKQYGVYALMLSSLAACKKSEFAEINTDPEKLGTIAPEGQFATAVVNIHNGDFEVYYDFYRSIMPFTRLAVPNAGNTETFTTENGSNTNNRYGYFYTRIGNNLTNVIQLISAMSEEEQAKRVYEKNIAQIVKTYYAWYVSDVNGSIPYSEAFMARYTGVYTPKYDTQAELFPIWDAELKAAVTALETQQSAGQISYGLNDIYYGGDVTKWIKVGNSLRLKIASRLSKVDPAKFKSIGAEVLADNIGTFESIDDDWALVAGTGFTGGGNWNPTGLHATKSMVDFMLANNDPRIRNYFQQNDYSKENFDSAKIQGKLPASAVWSTNRYVGNFSSPDEKRLHPSFFILKQITKLGQSVNLDSISPIQYRLFSAESSVNNAAGTGVTTLPLLTYADICFLKAELAVGGTGTDAEGWYNKGVEASIKAYDRMADKAKIPNYIALNGAEITAYQNSVGVKYDAANALPLIATQAYLHFFKMPNEAWAILKRLGLPDASSPLKLEALSANGVALAIPRRASLIALGETDRNVANNKAALAEMATNPDFGTGPTDVFGRVWWDKK